jgi:hypothetical protein
MEAESTACAHFAQIRDVTPSAAGCEDCLRTGRWWTHLRLCLTCGRVACCDESPGRHATGHWRTSGHPVMRSFEPGEDWLWCFEDQLVLEAV